MMGLIRSNGGQPASVLFLYVSVATKRYLAIHPADGGRTHHRVDLIFLFQPVWLLFVDISPCRDVGHAASLRHRERSRRAARSL